MKLFAIDTSGPVASVALAERTADGAEKLIGGFRLQYKTTHSQTLMPMAELLKTLTSLDMREIDAVAVAAGPGSFTGLRIGAATAKGLCLALDVPLIAVPTLDAIAYQMSGTGSYVCPMLDARRQQVYTGLFHFETASFSGREDSGCEGLEKTFRLCRDLSACAVPVEEIAERLNSLQGDRYRAEAKEEALPGGASGEIHAPADAKGRQSFPGEGTGMPVILTGDGVPVYLERLRALLKIPYTIAPFHRDRQSAEAVAALAFRYYDEEKFMDADTFSPFYLRPSQAERVAAEKKAAGNIRVRRMTKADVPEAYRLETENFSHPWTAAQLLDACTREDCLFLVAEAERGDGTGGEQPSSGEADAAGKPPLSGLLGLCGVQMVAGEGYITNVSVDKRGRRAGIAKKMLRTLLEEGRRSGIPDFTLEVRKGNGAARRLYESLGFREEGIRPGFYEDPKEDAVLYWLRGQEKDSGRPGKGTATI